MGRLWCRELPIVTVPVTQTPKRLTIVVPFYMNHGFLQTQLATWATYPNDLLAHVSVIVVDDGSPDTLVRIQDSRFTIRQFRIEKDVRWNWLAARNIGAHHADEGWLILTDMDHIIPEPTLRAVVYGEHNPAMVYAFSRREHTGEPASPHSASFLMHRATFWRVGGYDEALSGHYGTDGDFRRRVATVARMAVLRDELVRYERIGDSSTTRYLRKQPEDAAVGRLVARRGKGWRPTVLSFPFHEVTL